MKTYQEQKNCGRWSLMAAAAIVMSSLASCGGGDGSGSAAAPAPTPSVGVATGGIVDETGAVLTTVDTNDPVNLALTGLTPNTQVHIAVTDPSGTSLSPSGGFIATTDEDGALPQATVIQDLSTTPGNASVLMNKSGPIVRRKAVTGAYLMAVTDAAGQEAFRTNFTVNNNNKVYCADASGTARASFLPSESIYAKLERGDGGTLVDGTYVCHVLSDLSAQLEDQAALGGTAVSATVTSGVGLVNLGTGSSFGLGPFDVVCDLNGNGKYDRGADLMARPERYRACFSVQNVNSGGDIVGQICSDRRGNYRDVFDPNATDVDIRDVFAWITPQEQSQVQHTIGVRKYVVAHKTGWRNGDALVDVTGASGEAFELDAVQGFCTNEAPWLVWPRQRLVAGCYDCVIDVNHNGIYDTGIDFLDNIDQRGDDTLGGMCVANSACDAVAITSHTDGQSVDSTAITLAGTMGGTPDSGRVIISAGTQSQSIVLSVSGGNFSANIPLFNGKNHLTVVAQKAGEAMCSKSITVTSTATASATRRLQVQLTWGGATDMDLHLVRPAGVYANGGGGAGDCNYSNCSVGLDGAGSNSIDWGTAGSETDDPKLDVDCIACGNGVENIWMNDVQEDGAYRVYVDAYSGNETGNVMATIFIGGANVGQVNCGAMASGTATDSCFVGTIAWTGGTSGSGTFTAAGTKAGNF